MRQEKKINSELRQLCNKGYIVHMRDSKGKKTRWNVKAEKGRTQHEPNRVVEDSIHCPKRNPYPTPLKVQSTIQLER
jgi:hypothetical protein